MGKFRKNVSIILLLVILLTVCTSCKVTDGGFLSKTPDMNTQYEAEMKIQSGELEFSGKVTRYGTELWAMSIDAPETLAGLELAMNSDGVKAKLGELALDIPMEDVRSTAVFSLIFKALDNSAANKLSCIETEDGMYYEGECGGIVYRLVFDKESLEPVLLEIPEAALTAEFVGFEILSGDEDLANTSQTETEAD